MHEREHDPELLAVALRELVDRPVEDHLEALHELLAQRADRRRRGRGRTSRARAGRSSAGTARTRRADTRSGRGSRRCRGGCRARVRGRCPAVGRCRSSSSRIVVVLPAPLGPRNPNTCPGSTLRSRRSTATVAPNDFVNPRVSIAATIAGSSAYQIPAGAGSYSSGQPSDAL